MDPITVGFDLDMTLIDSRPGIAATYEALSAETGVPIDTAAVVSRLGPPLSHELANWFPADQVDALADRYREFYPDLAVPAAPLFAGARAALEAIRAHGGRVVVVTGKYGPNAQLHLDHLGVEVDGLAGNLWAEEKAVALREFGATVYVGDHVSDLRAARAADALAIGVATGPISADELRASGADVVLDDLAAFPAWFAGHVLERRLDVLADRLAGLGGVLVAFSGGADSALVLAAAVRVLGPDRVVAATAVSPSLPADELAQAGAFARALGVRHLTPATNELARDGYRANGGDRCYFCKAELLDVLAPLAAELGLPHVATGTNADDAVAGFRPGIRAAAERGAVTPLLDAGLTKAQVRAASQQWGLVTWDKPAAACLSSRIAYGVPITPARLARVELAESRLRTALLKAGLPVRDLRVRDLDGTAKVEVDAALVPELLARPALLAVVEGFDAVVVDERGFRSGAMNELLSPSARPLP